MSQVKTQATLGSLFSGYISIASSGSYTFYLNSDDGSALEIDGVNITRAQSVQGIVSSSETSASVTLSQGYHRIKV